MGNQEKMIKLLGILSEINREHDEKMSSTIGQFCCDHDTDVKATFKSMYEYGVYV